MSSTKSPPYDPTPVLESLRGQEFTITDFNAFFKGWPSKINPNLEKVRQDLDNWLESTMGHSKWLEGLKSADFGLFGATWWPQASEERLSIVTCLATWLFIWEMSDDVDKDQKCFWDDFERSQKYRAETLRYVRIYLGLSSEQPNEEPSRMISSFKIIGEAMRKAYNIGTEILPPVLASSTNTSSTDQCKKLFSEMEILMKGFELEQRIRTSSTIPSVKEFWECRIISSGVGMCVAANEFACGVQLPRSIMESPGMTLLWSSTNTILSTLNEILSMKEEMRNDNIQTLVPLLFMKHDNLQAAVDAATEMVVEGVRDFEEAVRQLSSSDDMSEDVKSGILQFVDACKYNCTGHLIWIVKTPRSELNRKDTNYGFRIQL